MATIKGKGSAHQRKNAEKETIWHTRRERPVLCTDISSLGIDFNNQSIPDPVEPGVRISNLVNIDFKFHEDIVTQYDVFQRGLSLSGHSRFLGWKADSSTPYQWMTYRQFDQRANNVGAGLIHIGAKAGQQMFVGVYSQNRPEYLLTDQACIRHSICTVPLYDTLGAEAGTHIINIAEISVLFCDNEAKVQRLLDCHNQTPTLNTIVVFDQVRQAVKDRARQVNIKLYQFTEVEDLGEENPVELTLPKPDDLYMLCFTSGTTGVPKGAMISHHGSVSNMKSCHIFWEKFNFRLSTEDIHFSYLPLAHAYERIVQAMMISQGCAIGFFQGDVTKLLDDLQELQPSFFPCVPRLLNRIYDKVMSGVNVSATKRFLFNRAIQSKKNELARGIIRNDTMWDKIIFSKIQNLLGGCVRIISTGSAPLSAEVLTFLKCVLGCVVCEGYGQTECTAAASVTYINDPESGHVGPPLPGVRIKLVDVPEMDYVNENNQGEVCIKGPNVIRGYLKNEEKTKEAIDSNGWLHTGDIGQWLPNGCLKIIDRKKNIFKLAQGEYIAPEKIENILVQSQHVAQVFVHGNSLESWLVAVVVPDPEALPVLAHKLGVSGTMEQMCADPAIKKTILNDLREKGKKNKFSSLEQVRDIFLFHELFSVENNLLTPTFKAKRNELIKFFKPQIDEMYERTKAAASSKL